MNKLKVLNSNLQVNKISKSFGNKQVVRNISLNINRGEIVGLLGPNGAGKTTTFYIIVGLISPDTGEIYLENLDVSTLPIYIRGQKGISYLPQEASIFRGMNVEDNLISIIEVIEKDKNKHAIILENLLNISFYSLHPLPCCCRVYVRYWSNCNFYSNECFFRASS